MIDLKERVHSEMTTCHKLDNCPHIQPITFPSQNKIHHFVPTEFPFSNFAHPGPASHHPRTCITPSEDLYHTIRGPSSKHPGPASHHPRTCITPSGTCITPSKDLHHTMCSWNCYCNLSGQIRIKYGRKWTQSAKSVK